MNRLALIMLSCGVSFAACDEGAEGTGNDAIDAEVADTSRPDAPTPWIYPDDEDEVTPSLQPAALQKAVEVAMTAALELKPEVVLQLHQLLYPTPETGSGDPTGCPFFLTYDYDTATGFYWQGECTASDGTMFSGYGSVSIYDKFTNEFGTFDGFDVNLSGRIEAADGTFLEGSGQAGAYLGTAQDLTSVAGVIDGTFLAGGPRAPDSPWLDGSRRPSLSINGWVYTPTGGRNVTVAGGIAGLDFPAGVSAVSLDNLTARQALAGASCERELGGGASVRGEDGNWYDVYFDGPSDEDADTPADLCDGCGVTWFRGAEVGATCVDARPFLKQATP